MFTRSTIASVAATLVLGGVAIAPAQAGTLVDGQWRYLASGGSATIVAWDPDPSACPATLTIPSTLGASIPVTEIDSSAFRDEPCLDGKATSSVILPGSVVTLGSSAFRGNSSLTSVTINGELNTLPALVFADDTALSTITFNAKAPSYTSGPNASFLNVPTGANGPRVIHADGVTDNGNAWGATWANFSTFLAPRLTAGSLLVPPVKKKSSTITLYPTFAVNSIGTIHITVFTKTKKGKVVVHARCNADMADQARLNAVIAYECVTGKAARNLVKKAKTLFYVQATFTQANTNLTSASVTTSKLLPRYK
jgi:hypothetical protein